MEEVGCSRIYIITHWITWLSYLCCWVGFVVFFFCSLYICFLEDIWTHILKQTANWQKRCAIISWLQTFSQKWHLAGRSICSYRLKCYPGPLSSSVIVYHFFLTALSKKDGNKWKQRSLTDQGNFSVLLPSVFYFHQFFLCLLNCMAE